MPNSHQKLTNENTLKTSNINEKYALTKMQILIPKKWPRAISSNIIKSHTNEKQKPTDWNFDPSQNHKQIKKNFGNQKISLSILIKTNRWKSLNFLSSYKYPFASQTNL